MRTWHESCISLLHMVDASLAESRSVFTARSSVQEAQQHTLNLRDWKYLQRPFSFSTVAKYTTGTVAYDHTGGASERLVTLTTGTWPVWAVYGVLHLDSKFYRVQTRLSDTTLQLKEEYNPGADVASGSTYTLFREAYPLPLDYSSFSTLNRIGDFDPEYVQPEQFEGLKTSEEYFGQARRYTIMADPVNVNRKAIWFYPAPNAVEQFATHIQRRPSTLTTFDESTGTVSGSLGSVSITGVGTAFDSGMVGAVFRVGSTTKVPESLESGTNNYTHEAEILTVDSATALTISEALPAALSGNKFRISSRLSVDDGPLHYAVMACARWRYRENTSAPASQQQRARASFEEALQVAGMEDGMTNSHTGSGITDPIAAALLNPQVTF